MRILLVSGHTSGHNYSANTGRNEGDLNIEQVKLIKPRLDKYADVDVYPYDRDMYKDTKNGKLKVNYNDYDYIFEVHFNGFNGNARGTSIQIHTNYKGGISVEQGIVDRIAAIGFKKRGTNGIVRRDNLLNMSTALSCGVDYALVEVCFYDNHWDMLLYSDNKAAVAQAIADGITVGFGLKKTENVVEPEPVPEATQPIGSIVVVYTGDEGIEVHNTPDFNKNSRNRKHGPVKKGEKFRVMEKLSVDGGEMYRLYSGLYITASEQYVHFTAK